MRGLAVDQPAGLEMNMPRSLLILCLAYLATACGASGQTPLAPVRVQTATGPLRVNPANTHYFTDGTGKAIYLTGSHTWANFMDRGALRPPGVHFDYPAYLKWMVSHNFNFMRLWTAELPNSGTEVDLAEGNFVGLPWKWSRTGPGIATDGGLKFDLTRLDQDYFDRMRSRVISAGQNGIYVSVMLFNGFEWQFDTNTKDGNPFLGSNNINNINCPGTCPTDNSQMPDEVWNIEQAYIRKVVDTVNDLDNVLYEVSNEVGSPYSDLWQYRVIGFVKQYEASKPKQHPVGMTFQYEGGSDLTLYKSPADWISPAGHLPPADGTKVIINDTDHSYYYIGLKRDGLPAQRAWVWENFTSGNNVAFMDPYLTIWPKRNAPEGSTPDPEVGAKPDKYWDVLRNSMGSTLTYANRMNLVAMTPQPSLSSTHFCLANPGVEYLVYQPSAGAFTVTLAAGNYHYEWLNTSANSIASVGTLPATDGARSFSPPFSGDAVLYLYASTRSERNARTATGPLRRNPANPRYFTDGTGKAIYLTGSHTWSNFLDRGTLHPPQVPFDYAAYMNWMVAHNFSFMRLWTAELPDSGKTDDPDENVVGLPWKWSRTGPGYANDGGLKFDLTKLDQNYYDRMRTRIITAGKNGIYVSVMLFNGYEWQFEPNPKDGNPFYGPNNINGVDCPGNCPTDTSQMSDEVWNFEQAYIRRVVDTVNDLDNVLYEVSNESGSPYSDLWQYRVIDFVKQYESTKPKQHPVGMTFQWKGGSDLTLHKSPADWISPGSHLPPSDGTKVIINDTDHSYGWPDMKHDGLPAQRAWVWENFASGNNVAFMDPYLVVWPDRNAPEGSTADPYVSVRPDKYWDVLRNAMGSTLTYANRMNLVAMTPQPSLSSTRYCLANPGVEYLVYQPSSGAFTVILVAGNYQYEWLNPSTNSTALSGTMTVPDGNRSFSPPFSGDAVLYLRASTR